MVFLADIRIVDIPDVVISIEIDEQVTIATGKSLGMLVVTLSSSLALIHYCRPLGFSEMAGSVKVSRQSLGHAQPWLF